MCFDDFTKQGYNILHKLMTTHNVTVATTLGKGNNNKKIYLAKAYRYLAGKGFSYDEAEHAVRLFKGEDD